MGRTQRRRDERTVVRNVGALADVERTLVPEDGRAGLTPNEVEIAERLTGMDAGDRMVEGRRQMVLSFGVGQRLVKRA